MQRAETRAYTHAKLMLPSYQPGDPSARAPPGHQRCPSPLFIVFSRASNPKKRRKSDRIKPCYAQSTAPATHVAAPVVNAIEKTRPRQIVPNFNRVEVCTQGA